MAAILVIHGPNLNLLGMREPEIYGSLTLGEINHRLVELGKELGVELRTYQSNNEGDLINTLQEAFEWANGIIFNPGGYTHTSVALRDTIKAIGIPVIEVHLSNIHAREEFRRNSYISPVCLGTITGLGWRSYALALRGIVEYIADSTSGTER